ncbi:MAG: ptsP, partial [Daejeonella sp.]|nr:ptsP [Daejeonella sp.]
RNKRVSCSYSGNIGSYFTLFYSSGSHFPGILFLEKERKNYLFTAGTTAFGICRKHAQCVCLMNRTIKGIGVSPGISIGRAHIIQKNEAVVSGELVQNEEAILHEIAKYDQAVSDSLQEIEAIKTEMTLSLQEEDLDILETQIELLNDPQLKSDVVHKITSEQKNANDALIEVTRDIVQVFKNMDDEYMSARSVVVDDICNRILWQLNH